MTVTTDKTIVCNGTDFTFVCKKIPFAISCSSELPHGDVNLIDLDLIIKMGIPLRNIKVTRMSLLGHDVRAVGRIKQTIQCVHKGRVQGTIHLQAKVVRDLYGILGVDCVASAKTYFRLTGQEPPDPPDEEYDDEDHQKDVTDLDDTIADNANSSNNADGSESVKDDDKNEHNDDDRKSTAKKDEVKDDDNNDERDQGTEVYEEKKGVTYNWFRPQSMSYDPCPRQGDDMPPAQTYGYDDTDEDNDHDALYEPLDPTHDDEKFCKSCYMSDYPPHVFQSHHTSQILACPSISNIDKQRLIERYKKGLYKFPSYPK
jgi:hypothetical protein